MSYHHLGDGAEEVPAITVTPAPIVAAVAASEGAFNMGARAMRAAISERLAHEWPGPAVGIAEDRPLPDFPPPPPPKYKDDWQWWSGNNEEYFTNGPFATREDAIEALDGEAGYIVEAMPGRMALSADQLIEHQYFENDDYFCGEHGEPDRVGGMDQIKAADDELQAALDAWLARWRHTFVAPEMFHASRNGEYVPADYASDGPLTDEESAELADLESLSDPMIYQLERRYYLRARRDFFAEKAR